MDDASWVREGSAAERTAVGADATDTAEYAAAAYGCEARQWERNAAVIQVVASSSISLFLVLNRRLFLRFFVSVSLALFYLYIFMYSVVS